MAFSFRVGTNWCHDFPRLARESGFHFNMHRRRVRVDWNRIGSIDIDRVIADRDFTTIDDNVNNVIDYCLESEYDVKILDPNFVKLFRLAQLAVEYLLYCKQYLDRSVVILKDELRAKVEENSSLRSEIEKNEKIVKDLKERRRAVEAKLSDSHGEVHKCPQCPKTFISAQFMNAHVSRRHANISRVVSSSPVNEQYRAETEKLHDEIKSLKERLNLTERVIRNESEKFLSSESFCFNDNRESKTNEKNETLRRDPDEIIKEQHRKYQEEIGNLKATLFDEIRSLKAVERNSRLKSDSEDYASIKELIRDQENEIRLLRQQIVSKEPQPEAERSEKEEKHEKSGREALEEFWQSKVENLESRHREDIEKLFKQLKESQESAERTRIDYLTRIGELERREASLESKLDEENRRKSEKNVFPKQKNFDEKTSRIASLENFSQFPAKDSRKIQRDSQKKRFVVENSKIIDNSADENSENSSSEISEENFAEPEILVETPKSNRKKNPKRDRTNLRERERNTSKISVEEKVRKTEKSKVDETKRIVKNGEMKNRSSGPERRESAEKNSYFESVGKKNHEKFPDIDRGISEKVLKSEKPVFPRPDRKKWQLPVQDHREKSSKLPKAAMPEREKIQDNFRPDDDSESLSDESETSLEGESSENSSSSDDEKNEIEIKEKEKKIDDKIQKIRRQDDRSFIIPVKKRSDPMDIFLSKLRELGIDPEWRGIPDATFVHVIETLRHHRKINSKKYRKFEDIRRKLLHELSQKLISTEALEKIGDKGEKTQLARLVTNVRSKVSKAWNILEKNDGSYTSRTPSKVQRAEVRKVIPKDEELRTQTTRDRDAIDKSSSTEEMDDSRRVRENFYVNSPVRRDLKEFSHSYESIKDFVRDNRKKIVSSTPYREEDLFPGSPKNGRGVLKLTSGSAGSLTKKKVLFDLESPNRLARAQSEKSMYPREDVRPANEKNDSPDSEFDISSIHDEGDENQVRKTESVEFGKTVLLRTTQSDKIAQISQQIEKQLSLARKKPAGAIEAMFMKKFEKRESPIDVYPNFDGPTTFFKGEISSEKLSQRIPVREAQDSRLSRKSDDEVANLESDIDELLKLE